MDEDDDESEPDVSEERAAPCVERQMVGGFLELELLSEVRDAALRFAYVDGSTLKKVDNQGAETSNSVTEIVVDKKKKNAFKICCPEVL